MTELIDTTEMYLRIIFELEEEGTPVLRARIVDRIGHSGPTVSQTVARMERDGLVSVEGDRHLELSDDGRAMATRVMRKHRLAECLLVDVIGIPWEDVHAEACRWEHVMSETVERRLVELLNHPTTSPYGNPIPGLDELEPGEPHDAVDASGFHPLTEVVGPEVQRVIVRRIAEPIQDDATAMATMHRIGATPGATVKVRRSPGGVNVGSASEYAELADDVAVHILVESAR